MISSNIPTIPSSDQVKSSDSGKKGQARISCPFQVVNEGVDTISLTIQADVPEPLIAKLSAAKKLLQESSKDDEFVQFGETTLFSFNLQRMGIRFYPYVLRCGDVTLAISARDSSASIASIQISIGSISSQAGVDETLRPLRLWLLHYGCVLKNEKVSRIDLAADIEANLQDLDILNRKKYITRAEKFAAYWSSDDVTGVQLGKGVILCRIYDKIEEMAEKRQLHKEEFFSSLWGPGVENVTRVEFQMRREAIKQFFPDDSSWFAVKKKICDVWSYLTTEWLRQTDDIVDRANKNQQRAVISPFWSVVQSAFGAFHSKTGKRCKGQKHINVKALIDQAAGLMLTVAAAAQHAHDDYFGILATVASSVQNRVAEVMERSDFEHSFYTRAAHAMVTF